jgi:hypothetical protein
MSRTNQSNYDIMFGISLTRGYVDCAKLLYPYVTDLTTIKLYYIIREFYCVIDDYDNNEENCNDNPDLENIDSLLQRYHDVFEFLIDINFVYDTSRDRLESFFLTTTYDTYKMLKNHPIYYKMAELIFQIMNFDKTKIIFGIINRNFVSGLYLLSDMNVLESSDMEFADTGFYVSEVDKYIKLLMKYHRLTNDNLQKIMNVNLHGTVGSHWADDRKIFTNLINFVRRNNFHFVVTNEMLANDFDRDTYQKILDSGLEWRITKPVVTMDSKVYELLQEHDIDVVLSTEDTEDEEEDIKPKVDSKYSLYKI